MATLAEVRRLESLARVRELERLAEGGPPVVAGPPDPIETLTATGQLSNKGRPLFQNQFGESVSERTVTVTNPKINDGAPTNIPTIFDGRSLSESDASNLIIEAGGKDPVTGEVLSGFSSIEDAVAAAQLRSDELGDRRPSQFQSRFPEGSFKVPPVFQIPPSDSLKNLRDFTHSNVAKEVTIATSALAGAELGFKLPLPPQMKALAGIAGAGIGGTAAAFGVEFGGAATEGQSLADIEFGDLLGDSLKRGGEELLAEATGQQLMKGFRLGKDVLRRKIFTSTDDIKLSQELLERSGTGVSLGRATDNAMFRFLDDALRSSPATSTMFEKLDLANEKAFRELLDTEATHIAGQELRSLSPNRVGLFTIDAIKGGDHLFGKLMERHYNKIDELVPSGVIQDPAKPGALGLGDVRAQPLKRVPPVDMVDAIKFAKGELDDQVTKRISQSAEGQRVIDDLESLADNPRLTFAEAHKFRSDILALKRSIPLDAVNRSQALRTIATAETKVTAAMNEAVNLHGTPTAKRHLKLLQKEWKTSREIFNSKFVAKIFSKTDEASKVGDWAFSSDASPERIQSVYRAIDKAVSTSKGILARAKQGVATPAVKAAKAFGAKQADQAKKRLQGQYLRSRLATDTGEVGSADLFKVLDDVKAADQFKAAIPDASHRKAITDLLKSMRTAQVQTLTTGGRTILGIQMTRAALLTGAAVTTGGAFTGGAAGPSAGVSGAEGGVGGAVMSLGGLIFGTRYLADIMTNPALVRKLVSASKILSTDPTAGSVIARLGSELNQFLVQDDTPATQPARAGPL